MGISIWAGQTAEAAMQTKTNGGADIIQPFNYTGVQLLPGRQKAQFDQVRDFYMGLRPNDILRGFRLRHESWAPGKELGGAYSQNALCFGQWLGGLARVYKPKNGNDLTTNPHSLTLITKNDSVMLSKPCTTLPGGPSILHNNRFFVVFRGFSSSTGVAPLHPTNGRESGPVVGPLPGNLFQWNRFPPWRAVKRYYTLSATNPLLPTLLYVHSP